MDQQIDLKKFILSLKNKTNVKGSAVVLKHKDKSIAVVIAYDDYVDLINAIK